jgi:hypothetical protein
MNRFGKLILIAAASASLPAMALAQRGPEDQDRNGNQIRAAEGQPGFRGGRGPEGRSPGRPPQERRDFGRERGPDRNVAGAPPQVVDERRDNGRRFDGDRRGPDPRFADGRRPDDRRFDGRPDDRRFDGRGPDGRRFNDPRSADRRFDGPRDFDRRFDGRPGDNRWVGSNWRQDRRFDWRGYRDLNRDRFRAGRYIAPRGWSYGYRRFSIGAVLPGPLWGSGFWLDDPYAYRLPPAYGPYRWVRYYDDVLLIDIRTGRVIDAIPGFFW